MNEALQVDYLFVGARIRERLADQVLQLATPGSIVDVENLSEQAIQRGVSDAIAFVGWDGDQFETGEQARAGGGRSQAMRQVWTVLVAVRNAAQQDGNARNVTVGPLLGAIHKALAGWAPPGGFRPLLRVPGRRPPQYASNVGLYPLTFEISLTL